MNRVIGLVASIFVTLFLAITICIAQGVPGYQPPIPGDQSPIGPGYQPPIPGGQSPIGPICQIGYHFDDNARTCVPDNQPTQQCRDGYHFDDNARTCVPDNQPSQEAHPTTGPSYTLPNEQPGASTSGELTSLNEGQTLSKEQIEKASNSTLGYSCAPGMMCTIPTTLGIQYWVWYNWKWTTGPSAEWQFKRMNTVIYNDQAQHLYGFELDPTSKVTWRDWGYRWPGYTPNWFRGDVKGWHVEAIWGSKSGWSNILYILVW